MNTVKIGKRFGVAGYARRVATLSCVAVLVSVALSTSAAAQAHTAATCADAPNPMTNLGVWPSGIIPYVFEPGYPWGAEAEAAMRAWEEKSGHVIEFRVDLTSNNAKLRIHDCKPDSGESWGFDKCKNGGCDSYMCPYNMNHELGHAIGLMHHFDRNDRDHYMRMNLRGCRNGGGASRSATDDSDFGPFNYQSTMMYRVTHPDHLRWNGLSVCHKVFSHPGFEDDGLCDDGAAGPFGDIKDGDGAAVIELYQRGSGWDRFRRTFGVGNPNPYTTDLIPETDNAGFSGDVTLHREAAPAIETWGGESFAVYARTTDGRVATKSWDDPGKVWQPWTVLAAVPSTAQISDPAVTSWGVNRTDLAVTAGDTVFIMSSTNWNTWESLGVPPGGAASAPAITSMRPDEVMVVVRSTDSRFYFRECTASCSGNQGTWSAWAAIGMEVFSGKPALVSRGDRINLAAHGLTDTVWLTEYNADGGTVGWTQWGDEGMALVLDNAGCADCNSPALGSHSPTSLDIYVRGQDKHVWVLTWNATGRELETRVLGAVTETSPGVATVMTPGRADVFASMLEERVRTQYLPGIWRKVRRSF